MTMLIVALTLAAPGASPVAETAELFEAPVRLEADTGLINTGEHVAHSGPLFADYDGDGLPDLIVGNFRGHFQLYRNAGTRSEPVFEDEGLLEVDGEPVRIHNW